MDYDKALVAGKLRRWEKYLLNYRLPMWGEIPDLGLYMEQVISLMEHYLDYLPPELKEEQFITAATINNYVRKKIMPEPVKKKYYRIHIAYLIMICTLKQSLSIVTLQPMIPMGISEEEVREIYDAYASRHGLTIKYFIEQVRMLAAVILDHDDPTELSTGETSDLISTVAILGGLHKLMAEKLLLLEGRSVDEEDIEIEEDPRK